ncbi:Lrp/AsnC family transcriptional regulator [Cohnella sp. REN36]|uniref:Lrp/AsnC family transcriptional regulator n=1 Tax=Cohnella sp. REN36 TaxID=2887347 RepID=UPI001D14AA2F|nr:Lrp/AsnC family transcriptional regulator [Cohnella sp. REN36]MCC3376019.1 Lrp/AsnC family transcriptional regulator [Cohnella sp. REN36]
MIDYTPDETDIRILTSLREDATRSHKEIGQLVHLTGQAVGARVRRLEDAGIIEGYAARIREDRMGFPVQLALVTVFMHPASSHEAFQRFVREQACVREAQRVSGEGCYWLRVQTRDHEELNGFLDDLLRFGNYRTSLSTARIK